MKRGNRNTEWVAVKEKNTLEIAELNPIIQYVKCKQTNFYPIDQGSELFLKVPDKYFRLVC